MTIAAGIVCGDGLVIGSDTEITAPTRKLSGEKVFYGGDQLTVSVGTTGAGAQHMISYAIQRVGQIIAQPHEAFRTRIESAVSRIYAEHIWPAPQPLADDLSFGLLFAYWTKQERLVLFKTEFGTGACVRVDRYDAVGTGRDIGVHVLGGLFTDDMSIRQAIPACAHMIREAKHAHGVGGDTRILALHQDGRLEQIDQSQIADFERVFDKYAQHLSTLAMMSCDRRIHQADLDRTIDDFTGRMKAIRSEQFKQEQLARWADEGRIGDTPSRSRA